MNRASSIRVVKGLLGPRVIRWGRCQTCPYALKRYMSSSFSTMVWKAVAC